MRDRIVVFCRSTSCSSPTLMVTGCASPSLCLCVHLHSMFMFTLLYIRFVSFYIPVTFITVQPWVHSRSFMSNHVRRPSFHFLHSPVLPTRLLALSLSRSRLRQAASYAARYAKYSFFRLRVLRGVRHCGHCGFERSRSAQQR